MSSLIFIDTNIFLDFYRMSGREAGLSILNHIDNNHEYLICSSQIEMEYKKNRQKVIWNSYREIKSPSFTKPPVIFLESKQYKAMENAKKKYDKHIKDLKNRFENVLKNPSRFDPVYRTANRLFKSNIAKNLNRNNKERFKIRELAQKRFMLGYPPRKNTDNSIGDAINWEWIIECARITGKNVVVVSRDGDYGETCGSDTIINDWLFREFKERLSKKRKIELTTRLTDGLKIAGISVTKEEQEEEDNLIKKNYLDFEDRKKFQFSNLENYVKSALKINFKQLHDYLNVERTEDEGNS